MINETILWCKTHNPKNLLRWIKRLRIMVRDYDHDMIELHDKIRACDLRMRDGINLIKERTTINADISMHRRDSSQVIVIGRYRNADYVQVFDIQTEEFSEIIRLLRNMEEYGNVRRIDAPPVMKAVFEHELGNF